MRQPEGGTRGREVTLTDNSIHLLVSCSERIKVVFK